MWLTDKLKGSKVHLSKYYVGSIIVTIYWYVPVEAGKWEIFSITKSSVGPLR